MQNAKSLRTLVVAFLLAPLLFAAPDAQAKDEPYKKGSTVRIEGRVIDDLAEPLPGVEIVFAASRLREDRGFRSLFFGDQDDGVLEVLARTDADGRFVVEWVWDRHHDHFEAIVAAPTPKRGGERWELHRSDVTERFNGDLPVVLELNVRSSEELRWLRRFLDGSASADERRVFEDLGRPERIDVAQTDYDPDNSWWYFAAGQVYRFRDGKLEGVESFEPVTPSED